MIPRPILDTFEAFKKHLATELGPSLELCVYSDRGNFRCLESHPRNDMPIDPGCEPYVGELYD